MISVLLEQNILAPITSVRLGISQMTTIQVDCYWDSALSKST
jgi:hypothetical protein